MRRRLTRHWFLLALVVGGALAVAWPAALDWARPVHPRYVMPLALFLTAWTMPSRRLLEAIRPPGPAMLAVTVGFTLPPLLAWGASHLLPEDLRVGLLVMCCGPCTLASAAIWTRLAHGDDGSAILATLGSSALGWLVTPALLAWTIGAGVTLDHAAMMRGLAATLVLPVVAGQLLHLVPPLTWFAAQRSAALNVLSRVLVLVVLFGAARDIAGAVRDQSMSVEAAGLTLTAVSCLAVHALALAGGWLLAAACSLGQEARIAVAFCSSQKTLPVALVIIDLYFPGRPLAVLPLVLYHAGQLTLDTLLAQCWAANPASPAAAPRV
jgi:sodium/bile acid cotransporter 7